VAWPFAGDDLERRGVLALAEAVHQVVMARYAASDELTPADLVAAVAFDLGVLIAAVNQPGLVAAVAEQLPQIVAKVTPMMKRH
jgi:hypothetical protein